MFRSAVTWMASPLMLAALGEPVIRRGNTHQFFAPVSVYPTRDGYVYIAVGNDRQWEALTTMVPGFESLTDETYQRNAGRIADVAQLNQRVSECTRSMPTDDLIGVLNRIGVPVAKVNSLDDVLNEPLLRDAFACARDERSGLVVKLSPVAEVNGGDAGRNAAELSFPPRLGEHNDMIYGEVLGYNSNQLAELRNRNVI
jgi:formyl-CoA transferase